MRLAPRKTTFFDLFDQHAENLVQISRELREMLQLFDRLPERQARIKDLEHRGDQITHELATELHSTFVTPLDKEDIAAIASGLDDVADFADDAADRIVLYQIPASSQESRELADVLVRAVEILQGAVSCMRTTRDRERVITACREIHRLENEGDTLYRRALADLFNTPNADPIMVMKWREIYDGLEKAIDQCEDVANVLESVQLKYA